MTKDVPDVIVRSSLGELAASKEQNTARLPGRKTPDSAKYAKTGFI